MIAGTLLSSKKFVNLLSSLKSYNQFVVWLGTSSVRSSEKVENSIKKTNNVSLTRYHTNNIKELPIATQEELYKVDDKAGFVPTFYEAMAYRPDQFEMFIQYRNSIVKREGSNLKKDDLELIGLVAGCQHGCLYCIIAHSALHRVFSKNPYLADQVAANHRTASLSERQLAIAALAAAVARCQVIDDHYFSDLEKQGLTTDDAWDIASMASFTTMASGMINFLQVKPNHDYYKMGRR